MSQPTTTERYVELSLQSPYPFEFYDERQIKHVLSEALLLAAYCGIYFTNADTQLLTMRS